MLVHFFQIFPEGTRFADLSFCLQYFFLVYIWEGFYFACQHVTQPSSSVKVNMSTNNTRFGCRGRHGASLVTSLSHQQNEVLNVSFQPRLACLVSRFIESASNLAQQGLRKTMTP